MNLYLLHPLYDDFQQTTTSYSLASSISQLTNLKARVILDNTSILCCVRVTGALVDTR